VIGDHNVIVMASFLAGVKNLFFGKVIIAVSASFIGP